MVNRFVIALAAAAAVMALLVAVPRLMGTDTSSQGTNSSGQFRLEYDRILDSGSNESLVVNGDGQTTLTQGLAVQSLQLPAQNLTELKSLVLDTGFMNIKSPQTADSSGTNHELKVEAGDTTQDVSWRSLNDTQSGNAPAIVLRLQQVLDQTINAAQTKSP